MLTSMETSMSIHDNKLLNITLLTPSPFSPLLSNTCNQISNQTVPVQRKRARKSWLNSHTRTHTHTHSHSHTHAWTYTHTFTHAHTHTHTHTYTHVCAHTHTDICTCALSHTHTHTQTPTHIHTHNYCHHHRHPQPSSSTHRFDVSVEKADRVNGFHSLHDLCTQSQRCAERETPTRLASAQFCQVLALQWHHHIVVAFVAAAPNETTDMVAP